LKLKNRYRGIQIISRGGLGSTFSVIDQGCSPVRACVVKRLSSAPTASSTKKQAKVLLQQEALKFIELGSHPQIPDFYDYLEQDQRLYLVQEFIDGDNLVQIMDDDGTFNESQIWQLLDEMLPVLQFIHDHKVIHRDIKPENIIRLNHRFPLVEDFRENQLVLVDLGAAQQVNDLEVLPPGIITGSAEYVAPEQARGRAVFASDLYSLGVSCIYLLTGVPTFDLFDSVNDCWVWRDYLTQDVSDRLGQILDQLIQNNLRYRFRSVEEVMHRINQLRGDRQEVIGNRRQEDVSRNTQHWFCSDTLVAGWAGNAEVNSVAISPDGRILASGSDHPTIPLWDLNTSQAISSLIGHSQIVNCVAFNPDGTILATGSNDQTIKLWNLTTGQEISTLKGHSHVVKSIAFSPDGEILASGSWDKTIRLWNVQTGEAIGTLTGHQLQVSAVAFSPCGKILASASFDRTIRLWNLRSPADTTLVGHAWAVLAIAFSPDGKILATGSEDRTIHLWDWETGHSLRTILGHSWSVVSLAFSPNGETLFSGSWDKTIKLWRVSTGAEIAILAGHSDSVKTLALHPNGQIIASGSKDNTIKLWRQVTQE